MNEASFDPDAVIDAMAQMIEIPVRPEFRDAVRFNLEVTARFARLVLDFPLPDDAEPGPVFTP